MRFYELADFDLHLSPSVLAEAATTLTTQDPERGSARKERS